jgi:hypothetical protein
MLRAAPIRLVGIVQDSASAAGATTRRCRPRWSAGTLPPTHDDLEGGVLGEAAGQAGGQRVPLALGAGEHDAQGVRVPGARGGQPSERLLGDRRRRMLVRDRPGAVEPQVADALLSRDHDVAHQVAARRTARERLLQRVQRRGGVGGCQGGEVVVERGHQRSPIAP